MYCFIPNNFGFIRRHISKGRPKMEKSKIIVKEDIVDFYDRLCEAYKNYPEGSQREKLKIQIEELRRCWKTRFREDFELFMRNCDFGERS